MVPPDAMNVTDGGQGASSGIWDVMCGFFSLCYLCLASFDIELVMCSRVV
jgi:hypothetical protein